MRKSSLLLLVVAFAIAFSFAFHSPASRAGSGPPQDPETRIEHVENGLLPPVVIKGRPVTPMNLFERMEHYKVPGVSMAVINNSVIEWARGYGVVEAGQSPRVTPQTLFQAVSISKPVTAMAVLRLVQQRQLNLDTDVNQYLTSWKVPDNEFTREQKVTLRRILSHSAGLTVHGFAGYAQGEAVPNLLQILDGKKPANSEPIRVAMVPGTAWSYSGGGYTVAQQLLIDVQHKPFPDIMDRLVLDKLDMKQSTFQQPLPADLRPSAAAGHRADGQPVPGKWHIYPEMAAAGLWTTPSDLARFAMEIQQSLAGRSNQVLSAAMIRQMLTPQIKKDGLGLFLDGEGHALRFSHGGSNEGFQCRLVAYAETGQGAVVMTNSDNGGDLAEEILLSIAKQYGWPDYAPKERALAQVDPKIYADYVGRYQIAPNFVVTISTEGSHLFAQQTGQEREELLPESPTTFFQLSEADMKVEFAKDEKGNVNELVILQGEQQTHAKKVP